MPNGERVRWCCHNRDCDWSMVGTLAEQGEVPPRCVCGSEMQKAEPVLVFTYLDFLRGETAKQEVPGAKEE